MDRAVNADVHTLLEMTKGSHDTQSLGDVITAEDVTEADDIRRDRALGEYGDFATRQIDTQHVRAPAAAAERFINAVAAGLPARSKSQPTYGRDCKTL